eukprot:CAMPEP_0176005344 /NCGR_PEP_ID=MMETSP0120_2-20121206/2157_1 /TAXON_ID=160619 /ORGANISM="Kryptoperidinium foliaceum, Strain CCMP 1326" /LENGTH=133 /DNA_ID=CAMNT_0017338047 /DNA_START=230 /DNA_END=631 /DNA_ORIENTATION=+
MAVSTSCFHLAQSDMVLEMKRLHASEGRMDEPSLAAMHMGMNTLFCKPAESILPIVAAEMISNLNIDSEENDPYVQSALYKILIIPPLIFSILEWLSWRRYNLTPQKTKHMREELKGLPSRKGQPVNQGLHVS